MDNKMIDKKISHIDCILESCQSPELRAHYMEERIDLGEQKIANCDAMLRKVMNQEASGLITEDVAEEMCQKIEDEKTNLLFETYPWFEDASMAAGLKVAMGELTALTANTMVSLIPPGAIGKLITAPLRKFILSRLSKYTMLHDNTVDFKKLTKAKYDLEEADQRGFHFKHAGKWLDKGISRVHVIIYSYKGKDVMGIAYTKDMHVGAGMNSLIEPVIKDGSFSKDQDYYVACMCTNLQLTHPSVARVLKQLRKEWSEKVDELKSDIQESVEGSIANGTHQERLGLILECAKEGKLNPSTALTYVRELKCAEMHLS